MTYDYVVVGGGTAGCVVATRLSEDPDVRVLLLEAGSDERRPDVEVPERWSELLGTDADWAYETVVQNRTGRAYPAPRGRVLGGSGSINCLTHLRGHRLDYEEWARLGADGWDYAGVLPYFMKMEDVPGGDPRFRGTGGPLHPSPGDEQDALSVAFERGARQLGHAFTEDLNAYDMMGVGYADALVLDGRRESTATAYLRPALEAKRPNLTVATGALARRLLLDGTRCAGVEYVDGAGALRTAAASAAGEVVLCSGAVGSPHLLMLSGIGPAADLEAAGVRVVLDAPGVGANLQDHIMLAGVRYRAAPGRTGADDAGIGGGSTLMAVSDGLDGHGPDLMIAAMNIDYYLGWQSELPDSFTFGIGHMRPRSRGAVRLLSADPDVQPQIDPRYVSDPYDMDQLIAGVALTDAIVETGAFADWGGASETKRLLQLDRTELESAIHEAVSSYFHLSGTCRMGAASDGAVVAPDLRVHGLDGLRVADASVMPAVVSCNTNAASAMIGEKAADLLRGRAAA
jgi:choline dehydrogenase